MLCGAQSLPKNLFPCSYLFTTLASACGLCPWPTLLAPSLPSLPSHLHPVSPPTLSSPSPAAPRLPLPSPSPLVLQVSLALTGERAKAALRQRDKQESQSFPTLASKNKPDRKPRPSLTLEPVRGQPIQLDALSHTTALGDPPLAWGRVELEEGVRVLSITETWPEPIITGGGEPHLFLGLELSGLGISLVHAAEEELLYISGKLLTVDLVRSERSETWEVQLMSFQA